MSYRSTRRKSLWLPTLTVVLVSSFLFVPSVFPVPLESAEPSAAQMLAENSQRVAELRRMLEGTPDAQGLWQQLLMMESMVSVLELQAERPQASAQERRQAGQRVAARVLAEWMAAQPDSAAPWLLQANRELDGASRESYILELVNRFPRDPDAVSAAAQVLRRRGEGQAATELLEAFLAARPGDSNAYRLVADHHLSQGNLNLVRELLEIWMVRLPEDPAPVLAWLRTQLAVNDPQAMRQPVLRMVEEDLPPTKRLEFCAALLEAARGVYREQGKICLRALAEATREEDLRHSALEQLLRGAGLDSDWPEVEWAASRLPEEKKSRALLTVLSTGEESEGCLARVARAKRLLEGLDLADSASRVGGLLERCSGNPAARAWAVELVKVLPPEATLELLRALRDPRTRSLEKAVPIVDVAAALEARIAAAPASLELWRALELALEDTAEIDRRREHLERWITSPAISKAGSEPFLKLAALLLMSGEAEQAALRLESVSATISGDSRVQQALLEIYLLSGETAKAKALGGEVLKSEQPGSSSGHLLLARASWATGEPALAARHYRAAISAAQGGDRTVDEYLWLVAEQGDSEHLVAEIEWLCRQPGRDGRDGGVEECAADHLSEFELDSLALTHLSVAVERAPENSRLLSKLARAAERSEDFAVAEAAWERMIELDRESEQPWNGLAQIAYRRGNLSALERTVAASQRQLGLSASLASQLLGKLLREQGQPERSVEVLSELVERRPENWAAVEELRLSHRALGNTRSGIALPPSEEDGSTPSEASVGAAAEQQHGAPSAPREMLERADALYAGLDGRVDLPAARELFERAAASGDALAGLRLAGLYHLGNAGFDIDRSKSSRLARSAFRQVESLAGSGEASAQYLVGLSYLVGIGVDANPGAARAWLERADEQGNPFAGFNLGWMYANGAGVAESFDQSARWYRRSADLGHAGASQALGMLLLERGDKEGLPQLRAAAERGMLRAQAMLGNGLLYGKAPIEADPPAAVAWLKHAADAGDLGALFDLGWAHLTGRGASADPQRAADLLQQAAEQEHRLAMLYLGWAMVSGLVPGGGLEGSIWLEQGREKGQDGLVPFAWTLGLPEGKAMIEAALAGFDRRAKAGDPYAASELAWQIFWRAESEHELERAVGLARKAAQRGSGSAMRLLGQAAQSGSGMPRDAEQAVKWFRGGAEIGQSFCMMFLSQQYFDGDALPRDLDQGLYWLRAAAETGNFWAWLDLGNLYAQGNYGQRVDLEEAARWKRKAADLGDVEARGWLVAHDREG